MMVPMRLQATSGENEESKYIYFCKKDKTALSPSDMVCPTCKSPIKWDFITESK